ncbi:MAG: hypothetical protein QM790_11710 [Nibricoccus sp.]
MKFNSVRSAWRYWVAGIALALIGVVVARVLAASYTGRSHAVIVSLGRLATIIGLLVIAIGINRRAKNAAKDESSESDKPSDR